MEVPDFEPRDYQPGESIDRTSIISFMSTVSDIGFGYHLNSAAFIFWHAQNPDIFDLTYQRSWLYGIIGDIYESYYRSSQIGEFFLDFKIASFSDLDSHLKKHFKPEEIDGYSSRRIMNGSHLKMLSEIKDITDKQFGTEMSELDLKNLVFLVGLKQFQAQLKTAHDNPEQPNAMLARTLTAVLGSPNHLGRLIEINNTNFNLAIHKFKEHALKMSVLLMRVS